MSTSYNNIKIWLNNNSFELLSDVEEYICTKAFNLKCLVVKVDYVNLGEQKFKNYCVWLERMKYKVRSTFGRKVTYECSICNEISETNKTNLMKGPTYCLNCSHYNYNQTCFNRKPFVFPSGRIDNVLGHEPLCLMELLKHYNEKDIITDTKVIPRFYYIKVSKITGKEYKGKYYPDIMLPDKIIEVKSEYTFNLDKENNIRKMKTVVLAGYNFEFWIYDTQKRLRVIRKDKC